MTHHKITATFDDDIPPEQGELVRLNGSSSIFALGEPVTVVEWRPDQRGVFAPSNPSPRRIEPCVHPDNSSMEMRVARELDHLHRHAHRPMQGKVQVECSPAYWREATYDLGLTRGFCVATPRQVSFGDRCGELQGTQVLGMPVVVVPDGGEAVLRPRWPGV